MPATDTTTPAEEIAVVIDDDSRVVDEGKLKKYALAFVETVQEIIPLDKSLAKLYASACGSKAKTRRLVLVSDGEPDWTGATAAYRSAVAEIMDVAAFKGCSAARLETVKNNLKSHMRRGILDGEIMDYVRTEKSGLDQVEKGKEKDSAAFRAEMRRQYGRAKALKLANPIACPDHWNEPNESSGTGSDVDAKSEDTTASAVSKAVQAIGNEDMSVAEILREAHRLITAALTPAVQPNAKVKGGRDAAALAARDLAMQVTAAAQILSNKVTGDALTDAQNAFTKYSYSDNS